MSKKGGWIRASRYTSDSAFSGPSSDPMSTPSSIHPASFSTPKMAIVKQPNEGDAVWKDVEKDGVQHRVFISKVHEYMLQWSFRCQVVGGGYVEVRAPNPSTNQPGILARIVYNAAYGVPVPPGKVIDHLDRNPLNNTITNLEARTYSENAYNITRAPNKTGFKGVTPYQNNYGETRYQANFDGHCSGGHLTPRRARCVRITYFKLKDMKVALENEEEIGMMKEEEEQAMEDYLVWEGRVGKNSKWGEGCVCWDRAWVAMFESRYLGRYKKEEEGWEAVRTARRRKAEKLAAEDADHKVVRDEDGDACLITKKGERIKVDDDIYFRFYRGGIHVNKGYSKVGDDTLHKIVCSKDQPHHVIDHINRNKLDCRRANLRSITVSENNANAAPRSNTREKYITQLQDGSFNVRVPIRRIPNKNPKIKGGVRSTFKNAIRLRDSIIRRRDRGVYGPWP